MRSIEHATPFMMFAFVFAGLIVWNFISRSRRGEKFFVRRLPGIDAVFEAIGRSAELGRPISFSTGLSGVGPVLYASMGVLHGIAQKCARYGSSLFIPQNDPAAMAVVEDVARDAYRAVGKGAQFDPQKIVFLSEEQFAFASGYMGLLHREKVGAAFLFGSFAGESLILAEAGQQVGAMQVAASVSPEQVAFFIATSDYTLIGEELFAASAYLSQEPVQVGSVRAQDVVKFLFFILIILGVTFATLAAIFPSLSFLNLETFMLGSWGIAGE